MAIQKLKKLASERLPVLSEEEQDLQEWENILSRRAQRAEHKERLMQSRRDRPRPVITKQDILWPKKTNKLYYSDSNGQDHYENYNPERY
jgi:hypothetical protein